jgi:hypothetical protein
VVGRSDASRAQGGGAEEGALVFFQLFKTFSTVLPPLSVTSSGNYCHFFSCILLQCILTLAAWS